MTDQERNEFVQMCLVHSEQIKTMSEDVKVIRSFIEGNGTPGLKVRVDRLEQFYRAAVWVLGVCFVAALGAIASITSGLHK